VPTNPVSSCNSRRPATTGSSPASITPPGTSREKVIDSVPELPDQNQFAIRSERHHIDPVVGVDDGKLSFGFANGMDELNALEGEDAGGGEDAHLTPLPARKRSRNRGFHRSTGAKKPLRREDEEAKGSGSSDQA
jgi:hypothetical protein